MKLLFDANVRVVSFTGWEVFPGSSHVAFVGLEQADDARGLGVRWGVACGLRTWGQVKFVNEPGQDFDEFSQVMSESVHFG